MAGAISVTPEQLLESINGQLTKYADIVAQHDQADAKSFGLN